MRDLLGNTLRDGSLLWWVSKAIPLRVARIERHEIINPRERDDAAAAPDKLILEVTVPIQRMPNGAETQLADFICLVNPDAEQVIEKMLGERKLQ